MTDPRYQDIEAGKVALLSSDDGGALVRLIAGLGRRPRRPGRHALTDHPDPRHPRRRARELRLPVAAGLQRPRLRDLRSRVGRAPSARPLEAGQLAVLGAGDVVTVGAGAPQDSRTDASTS